VIDIVKQSRRIGVGLVSLHPENCGVLQNISHTTILTLLEDPTPSADLVVLIPTPGPDKNNKRESTRRNEVAGYQQGVSWSSCGGLNHDPIPDARL
jgi:hypothetical protein